MPNFLKKFWELYEKNYTLITGITVGLFLLQVVHLYWLTAHVVFMRIFGISLFTPNDFLQLIIVLVDYTEIPALIGTSFIYINSIRKKGWNKKDIFFLVLLNSQWLHLFWISDEFVVDMFARAHTATILPLWLAWVAIGIDYLELPVMYDTTKNFIKSLANGN